MNVSLTKTLEEFVKEQVEIGFYNSASEVVRAGLRILREKEAYINQKIDICENELQRGEFYDMDDEFWKNIAKEAISEIKSETKK